MSPAISKGPLFAYPADSAAINRVYEHQNAQRPSQSAQRRRAASTERRGKVAEAEQASVRPEKKTKANLGARVMVM